MDELRMRLDDLGLSEYFDAFVQEGFDNWETVLDIMESDLEALNVKLGHRRKLQRAIFLHRKLRTDDALNTPVTGLVRGESYTHTVSASPEASTGKRKYKRHPKPDPNAPEKSLSAYVMFSNDVRKEFDDREVSFAEMAKIVGERWKSLPADTREQYETMAHTAKARYQEELARYKKTSEYQDYQEYLADFKSKYRSQNEQTHESHMAHSRASSSSEVTSLLERAGVHIADSASSYRSTLTREGSLEPPYRSGMRTLPTLQTGKLPAILRNAHSDPTPSILPPGSTLIPSITAFHRQGNIGITHSNYERDHVPMDAVTTLIPRPRVSNTRISSDENLEMDTAPDHTSYQPRT